MKKSPAHGLLFNLCLVKSMTEREEKGEDDESDCDGDEPGMITLQVRKKAQYNPLCLKPLLIRFVLFTFRFFRAPRLGINSFFFSHLFVVLHILTQNRSCCRRT